MNYSIFKNIFLTIIILSSNIGYAMEKLNCSICVVTTEECYTLVESGTTLPISYSETFTNSFDNQAEVRLELKSHNCLAESSSKIGNFDLPITETKAGKAQLQVVISIDKEHKLSIYIKDLLSKKENTTFGGYVK